LESGLTLEGLSADLLTYAECNNFQGDIFLAIFNDYEITSESIKVFTKIPVKYSVLRNDENTEDVK